MLFKLLIQVIFGTYLITVNWICHICHKCQWHGKYAYLPAFLQPCLFSMARVNISGHYDRFYCTTESKVSALYFKSKWEVHRRIRKVPSVTISMCPKNTTLFSTVCVCYTAGKRVVLSGYICDNKRQYSAIMIIRHLFYKKSVPGNRSLTVVENLY